MNNTTHRVYWTENNQTQAQDFSSDQMTDALKFCEHLRKLRIAGEPISFISMSSEMVDCVSLSGVDVTGDDYDWKKRRK